MNNSADVIRHLFVPGLLGPFRQGEHPAFSRLRALEALLAKSDAVVEPEGFAPALFACFDITAPADADLPVAAVSYLGETGEAPPGYLLRAEPLQLHPDRDHLLAFDMDDDLLDAAEIGEVVEAFNTHFGGDGLRLIEGGKGSLYLHTEQSPALRTHPLRQVIGRNIDGFLPEGADAQSWRGLLNETQMLCYGLDLNRQRESQGRTSLGGLWFSSGGKLPKPGVGPFARLTGNCSVSRGLFSLRPSASGAELHVDHGLADALARGDTNGWLAAVAALDARLRNLQSGALELHLHSCLGTTYRWHPGVTRRFWRRKRPLSAYLDVAPSPGRIGDTR